MFVSTVKELNSLALNADSEVSVPLSRVRSGLGGSGTSHTSSSLGSSPTSSLIKNLFRDPGSCGHRRSYEPEVAAHDKVLLDS